VGGIGRSELESPDSNVDSDLELSEFDEEESESGSAAASESSSSEELVTDWSSFTKLSVGFLCRKFLERREWRTLQNRR